MIIRHTVSRRGRAALASRLCHRALSTETTTTTSPPSESPIPPRPKLATTLASGVQRWVKKPTAPDTTRADFLFKKTIAKQTSHIGAAPARPTDTYHPAELIRNPPAPKDVTLEMLLAAQTHMGHHTSLWNPANQRYIHGVRGGTHIISLEQTAAHLRRAARVVEEVARGGGLILFVGTRKGHMESVVRAAELAGGYSLFTKWTPGTITNRDTLLKNAELQVVDEHDRALEGFHIHLAERRPVIPDLVVVLNPLENFVLLHECVQANVPTIGVIDTDADPLRVTYAIPANDDSLRSISVIAGVLGRAGELGQKRRLKAAKEGVVTWENQDDVGRFIEGETLRLFEVGLEEERLTESKKLLDQQYAESEAKAAEDPKAAEMKAMRKLVSEKGRPGEVMSEEQMEAVLKAVEAEMGDISEQLSADMMAEVEAEGEALAEKGVRALEDKGGKGTPKDEA